MDAARERSGGHGAGDGSVDRPVVAIARRRACVANGGAVSQGSFSAPEDAGRAPRLVTQAG